MSAQVGLPGKNTNYVQNVIVNSTVSDMKTTLVIFP